MTDLMESLIVLEISDNLSRALMEDEIRQQIEQYLKKVIEDISKDLAVTYA